MLAFLATYVVVALFISNRPTDLKLDPSPEFPAGVPEHASTDGDWRSQVGDVIIIARKPLFELMFLATLFLVVTIFVMLTRIVEFTTNVGLGRGIGESVDGTTGLVGDGNETESLS